MFLSPLPAAAAFVAAAVVDDAGLATLLLMHSPY